MFVQLFIISVIVCIKFPFGALLNDNFTLNVKLGASGDPKTNQTSVSV